MVERSNFNPCENCPIFKTHSNWNKEGDGPVNPESMDSLNTGCELGEVYFSRYFDVPDMQSDDFKPILDDIISSLPGRFLRKWLQIRNGSCPEIYGIQAKDVQGCGGSMTLSTK